MPSHARLFEIPPASDRVMVRTSCLLQFVLNLTLKYDLDQATQFLRTTCHLINYKFTTWTGIILTDIHQDAIVTTMLSSPQASSTISEHLNKFSHCVPAAIFVLYSVNFFRK
jgi:hypothetical protein